MRFLDRLLQRWRIAKARPWVPPQARVLDVGCHEGEFFRSLPGLAPSLGLEPNLKVSVTDPRHQFLAGSFPHPELRAADFDAIVMLAVIEHFPPARLAEVRDECHRLLRPGGRLIVTAPAPLVDKILVWLVRFGLIDGMDLHQHYGFEPSQLPHLFGPPLFRLLHHARFQLGLNHLLVFQKQNP